jgi:hypothetical protein
MIIKCYSVRLKSLVSISDRALKATAFDGSEAIIPKSQVIGPDLDVVKAEAYWITAWILEKKKLQYSTKKQGLFNLSKRKVIVKNDIKIEIHIPKKINPLENNIIDQLKK